ncbi:ankyrin 2,3/unc44 [Beauveria brongniartii RCEF 3172]|uniref:Ankyrin 2,3/unc44 n=1 Tax=Beauveria brongniartii RCEF 3172 TaxID=1081107 RepID=A0A167B471_9HYPO|nr:ankyrin 2,3/unc44 [Beauveria brongniartii RCEF 3172]
MSKVEQVYTAEDVLQWEESRLIDFLGKCPREGDRVLDISEVKGVDELSTTQLKQLGQKLSAAYVKLGTRRLDPDDLTARLAKVPAPVGSRDFDRENEERTRKLSTEPPSPPNRTDFERFCFDELTETDGRPAWPLLMLTDSTPNDERERQIAMWVSEEYIPDKDDDPPLVLSHQLKDWNEFRHKWQWNNRGMHAGEEGFNEYVAWSRRREHFYGRRHNPDWVEEARYSWDCEQEHPDIEGRIGQGLDDYASAVRTRLIEHKFYEPFQLAQNPREQDIRTTWVEYLCYLYYWQDHYAGIMARMEDEHAKAWQAFDEHLRRIKANGPSHLLKDWPNTDPLVVEIANLRNKLQGTEVEIDTYFQATKEYRRNEKLWRKQKKRAAWAREQIAAIAMEQEKKAADERAAGNGGGCGGGAGSPPDDKSKGNGKRKRSGQVDEARPVSKKARKGAREQGRGLVTAEKQKQDESGATRSSARLISGKTKKAAPRS